MRCVNLQGTKTTPKETAYSLYYITSLYAVLIFYNRRDIF